MSHLPATQHVQERRCPLCGASYPGGIAYCPNDGTSTSAVTVEREVAVDPLIGTTLEGRYRIERRIGEGGMGVVYQAAHTVLKRPLAVKVIRGDQAQDQEVVQRFVQEAQTATSIGHPNIVDVVDFGQLTDGSAYFVMEYLEGESLAQRMAREPLPRDEAIAVMLQIASALDAAHARGIVHRDMKPDNVFLIRRDGRCDFVKVLDFGVAKVVNSTQKITRTGVVFGTPHYMAPEQAAGQVVDHRVDIYAMGVIMYQVFAGRLPFEAESYMGVMTKHMYDAPLPPSQIAEDIEPVIEQIILTSLAKRPEDRFQSMAELRAELLRAQRGDGSPGLMNVRTDMNAFASATREDTSSVFSTPTPPSQASVLSSAPRQSTGASSRVRVVSVVVSIALGLALGTAVWWKQSRVANGVAANLSATPAVAAVGASGPAQPSTLAAVVSAKRTVAVVVQPAAAGIYLDGALLGQSEAALALPATGEHRIEVRLEGYATKTVLLLPTSPEKILVTLEADPDSARARSGSKPSARVAGAVAAEPLPSPAAAPNTAPNRNIAIDDVVDPWK